MSEEDERGDVDQGGGVVSSSFNTASAIEPGVGVAGSGLLEGPRAKRRRQNRRRIAETAIEMFERDGFAATTVDDIAAACDIGRRTFFRYFQGKEALLYPFLEESSALAATVLRQLQGGRTPESRPVPAMRAALLAVAADFQLDAAFHLRCSAVALRQHHDGRPLAEVTGPTLNDLAVQQTKADLADMMQVDPTIDPSPGLIAGAAITVFGSAYMEWINSDAQVELPGLVLERFTLLCRLVTDGF